MKQARLEAIARAEYRVSSAESTRGRLRALSDVFANRELLLLLVRRDIRARYKDSALGMLWALVRPIAQLIIYYVVIGQFLGAARGIPDFAVYVYAGLATYVLFSETIAGATYSIV